MGSIRTSCSAAASSRTFRIADVSNPNLTQFAKDSLKKANDDVLAGKPMWWRSARCWATGVPAFLLTPAQSRFFIQTPKQVTMIAQHDDDVRRVYLDLAHSTNRALPLHLRANAISHGIVTLKNRTLSPVVERFLAWVRKVAAWLGDGKQGLQAGCSSKSNVS